MHPTTANPSLAAQTAAVDPVKQAAYLVGGNGYLFRFVGATLTQPTSGCTNFSGNYVRSGVQLIGAPGPNVAVGLECDNGKYVAGYTSGYQGNKFPELQNLTTTSFPGTDADKILLQLYYDPRAATVKITAKDLKSPDARTSTMCFCPLAIRPASTLSTIRRYWAGKCSTRCRRRPR